ncbi:MAG: UMP kinase [Candidatus Moranbacteria bacterium]|nr:UMP kinase [Candidatus Moranbacteria bacterium]
MKNTILIKFGGSIMVPEYPDTDYLKQFKSFVEELLDDYRFILITGGGGVNRRYNEIAREIADVSNEDLDWIGIYATRLNAKFLISVFGDRAHKNVITDPTMEIDWQEDILVGAGWKPGWSTDYDSMILGNRLKAQKIIIATNTDNIYDKDPHKFEDARPLDKISWEDIKAMVGKKWVPRMHIPLDPSAIRYGMENEMKVISLNGRNLDNMKKAILSEDDYVGTTVQ